MPDHVAAPVRRGDAVGSITALLVLTVAIPARLVIGPLGAAGSPALLFSLALFALWALLVVGSLRGDLAACEPLRWTAGALAVAVLASYLAAQRRVLPAVEANAADRGLLQLCAWLGVGLAAAETTSRDRLETLLRRLVVAGGVLAGLGILEFLTSVDVVSSIRVPGLVANNDLVALGSRSVFDRVAGTASHPIEFGFVLAVILPVAAHFAIHDRGSRRRRYQLAAGAIALAIPMSVSRTAVLCTLVVVVTLFLGWTRRERLGLLKALPAVLVVLRLLAPGLLGTLRGLFTDLGADPSYQGRVEDYARANAFVLERPWFGRGFRTFVPTEYFYLDNQYLGLLIETGLLGLLAVIGFVVVGFGMARGARRRAVGRDADRSLGQALAAACLAVLAGLLTFDLLSFAMASTVTFLVVGCAGAHWRLARAEAAHPERPTMSVSPAMP